MHPNNAIKFFWAKNVIPYSCLFCKLKPTVHCCCVPELLPTLCHALHCTLPSLVTDECFVYIGSLSGPLSTTQSEL